MFLHMIRNNVACLHTLQQYPSFLGILSIFIYLSFSLLISYLFFLPIPYSIMLLEQLVFSLFFFKSYY